SHNSNTKGTLTVSAVPLTITLKIKVKTYVTVLTPDGTTQFTTSGLVNSDTVTSVTLASAGYAAPVTVAGSPYAITPSAATGSGLSNYNISYANGTLTVSAAPLTITAKHQGKTYGTALTPDGTTQFTTSGLVNSDTVTSVTLASAGYAAPVTVAGSPYAITPSAATGSGLSNYNISYANGTLTVSAAPLTITAKHQGKTYGTALTPDGTTQFTTSGLVNSDAVTSVTLASAGYAATATVAGSPYAITPSAAAGTGLGNYNISYANGTLTVSAAPLTITPPIQGKTYGTALTPDGTTQFTTSGLVNSDTVTSVTLASAGYAAPVTVAGSPYAITPSAATGSGLSNYNISYANGTLTVSAAPLTITAKNQGKTYGTAFTPDGTTQFTTSGLVNSDAVTSVTLASAGYAATATVAGSPYAITPSAAAGTGLGNYNISYANGTLSVTAAPLTITAKNQGKTYGTALTPVATTQFTAIRRANSNGVTDLKLASAGYAATATVAGSPYAITPSAATGSGLSNYNISYANGTLTVTKATLTVTPNNQVRQYSDPNPVLTGAVVGVVPGDNITGIYATAATTGSPVGTYTTTATAYDPNNKISNYLVT